MGGKGMGGKGMGGKGMGGKEEEEENQLNIIRHRVYIIQHVVLFSTHQRSVC
jgi:hypothetical protein